MKKQINSALLASATALMLAACTHVSRGINDQGQTDQVVFPAANKAVLKEGTFPTVEALRQVGPGVTKDQLYQLLGRPHFNEGLAGVREWDYLFHFRDGNEVSTCQYKVIFDKSYHGQSFYWLPASCADRLAEKAPEAPQTPPAKVEVPRKIMLSSDSLFRFGGGAAGDMLAGGREKVANVAHTLESADVVSVMVFGYTDRIGSAQSNLQLSQKRAETVRQLLIDDGLPASSVIAVGKGEAAPVSGGGCIGEHATAKLVACLQADRRVEIVAKGH